VNNRYTADFGYKIENIRFKNIRLRGPNKEKNRIFGLDSNRFVSGVHFENLRIDERAVLTADQGGFQINAFVKDLEFR
jgi:hypothetical protein